MRMHSACTFGVCSARYYAKAAPDTHRSRGFPIAPVPEEWSRLRPRDKLPKTLYLFTPSEGDHFPGYGNFPPPQH